LTPTPEVPTRLRRRGGDRRRGFKEAHEVGDTYMEVLATNVSQFFPDDVDGLKKRIDEIGVKFEAITGGVNPAEAA
jgi:hypothetical protein